MNMIRNYYRKIKEMRKVKSENEMLKAIENGINKGIKEMLDKEYDLKIEELTKKMMEEKDKIIGKVIFELSTSFSVMTGRGCIEIRIIK